MEIEIEIDRWIEMSSDRASALPFLSSNSTLSLSLFSAHRTAYHRGQHSTAERVTQQSTAQHSNYRK